MKMERNNPEFFKQITANGGTDNWEIIILESFDSCSSKNDSNKRVDEWKNHKNELSKNEPKVIQMNQNRTNEFQKSTRKTQNVIQCLICDCSYSTKGNYDKHLLTAKHKKAEKSSKKMDKMDKNGKILNSWNKVKVKGHVEEVYNFCKDQ